MAAEIWFGAGGGLEDSERTRKLIPSGLAGQKRKNAIAGQVRLCPFNYLRDYSGGAHLGYLATFAAMVSMTAMFASRWGGRAWRSMRYCGVL